MKKIKQLYFLLLFGTVFIACDKAEDLIDIDLPFSLDQTFTIVSDSEDDVTYSDFRTISASDDGNIDDNLDKIKNYTVEKLSLEISNVVTDGSPTAEGMILTITGDQSGTITLSITESIPIVAGTIDLSSDSAVLNGIKNMLVANETMTIGASATIKGGPVTFNLKIIIDGEITVSP